MSKVSKIDLVGALTLKNKSLQDIATELGLALSTVKQYLSVFNSRNKDGRVVSKKVDYSKMSVARMATEMCEKLDKKDVKCGYYSLQVYEVTNGDIDESSVDTIPVGSTLHYSKGRPSIVTGCKSMMDVLRNNREVLWRSAN